MPPERLEWERHRYDRFQELLAELGDIDDYENSPTRQYVETGGGKVPRRLAPRTVKRIVAILDEELPEEVPA